MTREGPENENMINQKDRKKGIIKKKLKIIPYNSNIRNVGF